MKTFRTRRVSIGAAVLLAAGMLAHAAPRQPALPEITLTVRVHDFAALPRSALEAAENTAGRLFQRAGVALVWLDCGPQEPVAPACRAPLDAVTLSLRLLPREQAARYAEGSETFGFALPVRDAFAVDACVFPHAAADLARRTGISFAEILGHLVAHELGHLLLGPGSHAEGSVMRPQWTPADFDRASRGEIRFSAAECAGLRAAAQARRASRSSAPVAEAQR